MISRDLVLALPWAYDSQSIISYRPTRYEWTMGSATDHYTTFSAIKKTDIPSFPLLNTTPRNYQKILLCS